MNKRKSCQILGVISVTCALLLAAPPAVHATEKSATSELIDQLLGIDAPAPGLDGGALYSGFIADGQPGLFNEGVLGLSVPTVPVPMRELVRLGPAALPDLIQHLNDGRPTKLEVGNDDSAASSRRVGVDLFMFSYFSDEYDPRLPLQRRRSLHKAKDFSGRYTVKVGDVCFALIGQIVNRRLIAVRYQPSAGLVINSPIESPELSQEVKNDWGQSTVSVLKSSLLADVHQSVHAGHGERSEYFRQRGINALKRLRLYFPETYAELGGDERKAKSRLEKDEASAEQNADSAAGKTR